jgi:hypothetical protein
MLRLLRRSPTGPWLFLAARDAPLPWWLTALFGLLHHPCYVFVKRGTAYEVVHPLTNALFGPPTLDERTVSLMLARAPYPTPRSLRQLLTAATRVRMLRPHDTVGATIAPPTDFQTPEALASLRSVLQISERPVERCFCVDRKSLRLDVFHGEELTARLTLPHPGQLRWSAWPLEDGAIASLPRWQEWLRAHDIGS